ncbi:hypothetical protein K461DRAFT_140942 [Myriangium duriaei CBS 260.36]|uniref:Acyltransferase 3 domain-containing protein n=1 Tax=Myriangium duriaei CBS 260.36 TaxID=1168546 RepID=A0A9P4J103_9PEZI|nr:hypothetical protein K461DRAFT_140942 [Myriangium duriaei CBS 260.36]
MAARFDTLLVDGKMYQPQKVECREFFRSLGGVVYGLAQQPWRSLWSRDGSSGSKLHSTSWMDGIRGLAAIAVFNLHFFYNFTHTVYWSYGTTDHDTHINQLPGVSLLFDGTCSVVVFFTVAGYVCSYRSLLYITTADSEGLFRSLPGTIFRRFFRLYLPSICSMFAISMLAYLGFYEPTRYYFNHRKQFFPGPGVEPQPGRHPTMMAQLTDWWSEVSRMINFWTEEPKDPWIDFHLWTIVHEFRASMHLFIVLVALAKCTPKARLTLLALMGYVYALQWGHWYCLCFFYGAIIAQLDILRTNKSSPLKLELSPQRKVEEKSATNAGCLARKITRTFLYVVAIYLMSFPIRGTHKPAPLYASIVNPVIPAVIKKSHMFPKLHGFVLLFYLLSTVPAEDRPNSLWHKILTHRFCLHMGRIMFGFYLVHGMILHIFGYSLPIWIWALIGGNQGMFRWLFGLLLGWAMAFASTLLAGELWTRHVEKRCVNFTKWLESICFEQ